MGQIKEAVLTTGETATSNIKCAKIRKSVFYGFTGEVSKVYLLQE